MLNIKTQNTKYVN